MGKEARTRFNAGELNINQIKLLEELPEWTWNPLDDSGITIISNSLTLQSSMVTQDP